MVLGFRTLKSQNTTILVFSLVLMQISLVLGAGYADGKATYNGAVNIILDNDEVCRGAPNTVIPPQICSDSG